MGRLRRGVKRLLLALGIDLHMRTEDRRVLQAEILPWLSGLHRGGRVLFVGCEWYTRGYRRWFDPDGYRTMDIDPAKAAHGATQHVTDSMANMAHHFPAGSLDLVICNGVIGWGLDDPADIEAALSATHTAAAGRPAAARMERRPRAHSRAARLNRRPAVVRACRHRSPVVRGRPHHH
ncbi:MAG: hypothetical protein R2878_14320 [Thermoleophilia bacterium]